MPVFLSLVLIALIGYIWGSIPAGYWMGKLLRGRDFDIRDYGSHKIGATNVLRTMGRVPALIVFIFDLSKGFGPALIALLPVFYVYGWGQTVAAILALLGHCFPILIGFKGGRGVSTGAGALLIISWPIFLISLVVTVATIAISRYVSLGSVLGSFSTMVCGIIFFFLGLVGLPALIFLIVAPGLVILFHYDNIGRLIAGKERKIGQKAVIANEATTGESSNVQA